GLNGLQNVSFEKADVFEFLTEKAGRKEHPYGMIILDPPAFTKSRSTVKNAGKGYVELNSLAMRVLGRGGWLVTCSCSRFMTPGMFQKAVEEAALNAGLSVKFAEKRGASPDHPVVSGNPETEYLKCLICQVV
ncbi:MAG: rRNA large subunit methyltransferase I, partial [Oscillospiraceae bacterium]